MPLGMGKRALNRTLTRAARTLPALGGVAAVLALGAAGSASARSFVPTHHKIFHGVSDTGSNHDFKRFAHRVGAHPAVQEDFYHWDTPLTSGALRRWRQTRTRGVLSLSTAPGGAPELISPRQIASGKDDHYLVRLNHSIAQSKQVVYIRLFPEMNGSWNPYSAYNANGTKKDRSHSTNNFRRAWQRTVLIVRGGKTRRINRELRQRHMPRILRASSNHDPIYKPEDVHHVMPHAKVAFMWTPQTISSPAVAGNKPGEYWPGKRFVDWVGADIYSKYASSGVWSAWKRFYAKWKHFPFVVGEYSPWNNDYSGHFTRELFNWAEDHGRVRALIYYRSVSPDNEFDINHWPRARVAIRHHLNKHRWDAYAPRMRRR